ncbi:hypothetical protein SAMN05216404_106174 [Nitrosospira multiformis]|uniref:Uncharacterized protein n=1 Tax=Nitrosospira multiformis TaxID=1231 RepID=A0A1H8ISL7_9PROT|nr:hypothetical protein [Nitrosospira multiformis]SEN71653.1 hypothetical protein SAMN05216404_106174 [Nitrosospira multiformis]
MTPEQFCYWLQGRAEMQPNNPPSAEEWKIIADHLKLVFKKETPVRLPAPGPSELKRAQDDLKKNLWPNVQPNINPFLDRSSTGIAPINPVEIIC